MLGHQQESSPRFSQNMYESIGRLLVSVPTRYTRSACTYKYMRSTYDTSIGVQHCSEPWKSAVVAEKIIYQNTLVANLVGISLHFMCTYCIFVCTVG